MRQCLKGKSKETRHRTAKSFWYYIHHFGERKQPFLQTLTPRAKSLVMLERLDQNQKIEECQDDFHHQNALAEATEKRQLMKAKRKRPSSQKPRSLQSKTRNHSHPNHQSTSN